MSILLFATHLRTTGWAICRGMTLSHRKTSEMTAAKIVAETRQCSRDNSVDHFRQMHMRYKDRPEAAQSSALLFQMPSSWLLGCIKWLVKELGLCYVSISFALSYHAPRSMPLLPSEIPLLSSALLSLLSLQNCPTKLLLCLVVNEATSAFL